MELTPEELDWLARHWVALNEFASNEPLPDGLSDKLHMFFRRYGGWLHYEFSPYDETIEAKIIAHRKTLGLED